MIVLLNTMFITLLFSFWIWRSELRERDTTPFDHALLILGKTSLFTYVAQYVIFQTLPYGLGLQGAMSLWGIAALCAVGLPLLYVAASRWNSMVKERPRTSRA